MSKLFYSLNLYAQLIAFLLACLGWGQTVLRRHGATLPAKNPLAIALGMGIMICILQALAIFGQLNRTTVLAATGGGALLCAVHGLLLCSHPRPAAMATEIGFRKAKAELFIFTLLAAVALPLMIAPLGPPLAWDELMYHLPHARTWAQSGQLLVNEWLRYPWFPYNFDLLFAASLTLDNDVLPHLIHAAAGGTTAWLIYRLGVHHLRDRVTAALAALLWLLLTRRFYGWAYVDMSVAMFILSACTMLQAWYASGVSASTWNRELLFTCAFIVGVAAGVKYQVLTLLPLFASVLFWHDRRPITWIGAAFFLCLPCIYWYMRNMIMTGDPVNPIGGTIFGFTDWNLDDYNRQFEDLARRTGWPHWSVWPALATPFLPNLRQKKVVLHALLVAGYMVIVWAATSRYPRYLIFAYPLLVLLSALRA